MLAKTRGGLNLTDPVRFAAGSNGIRELRGVVRGYACDTLDMQQSEGPADSEAQSVAVVAPLPDCSACPTVVSQSCKVPGLIIPTARAAMSAIPYLQRGVPEMVRASPLYGERGVYYAEVQT